MNTTTIEQSAAFGLNVLPALFSLQNEAFERLRKLTQLNLAVSRSMLGAGQAALTSSSRSSAATDVIGMPRQFAEDAQTYAEQVRQIDSQFMAAATRVGHDLHNQCNAISEQWAASFGQSAPFDSGTAYNAMQSVVGAMMRAQGMALDADERVAGARTRPAQPLASHSR
ncbi:phasin family protein [Trinickia sp. Y13]|uniref:phasin family protein n=1 Tax=Trinickia sp. Y13 TaxID=2917807 RepID=UPI002404F6D1|nr:phasin family protein [Trinickia sp. Y13]MDG0026188.1 phasin family protein [Trinickia sp. Y13]